MSDYKPREGSTAYLALQHLNAHGPTGEMSLAAAIDKEAHEIGALLGWAMNLGAIRRAKAGDEWVYSLGDGVPLGAVPADTPVAPLHANERAAIYAAKSVSKAIAKVRRKPVAKDLHAQYAAPLAGGKAASAPQGEGAGHAEERPDPVGDDDSRIRIALWSDGVLDIRRPGGHLVRFTKVEARAIVDYLEAISLEPVREEAA